MEKGEFNSPKDAIAGIGMSNQHFMLVEKKP